jgi:predicted MFS family arabinose efflux permease
MLGAALASRMLTTLSPKYILIVCMVLNVFVLLVFTLTKDFYILAVARALTGTFQIFFGIF